MPREIADSDADSDANSPSRPTVSPIPENVVGEPPISTLENDPFANLEFDQFLSPTQRLSSAIERYEAAQARSISSTDRFLQDVAQIDQQQQLDGTADTQQFDSSLEGMSSANTHSKAKRTLSDIESGHKGHRRGHGTQERGSKRAKTYGGHRSQQSNDSSLHSDTHGNRARDVSGIERLGAEASPDIHTQSFVDCEDVTDSRHVDAIPNPHLVRNYHQSGAAPFLQSNLHNASMTKSFMGGYEGINMDFRGAGLSLDTNANPFGSLSQASFDDDVNSLQAEKFASLFHHSQNLSEFALTTKGGDDTRYLPQMNHYDEMATSLPEKGKQGLCLSPSEHDDELQQVEAVEPAPKKRGRKPKSVQRTTAAEQEAIAAQKLSVVDSSDVSCNERNGCDAFQPRRSRSGTVDSINNHESQISPTIMSPKNRQEKSALQGSVMHENREARTNDLSLSDLTMIGVPKEMYVPRPSKSRSRQLAKDEDQDELHEDHEHTGSQKLRQMAFLPEEDRSVHSKPASTPVKKKAGKKSKVKRAKTSAAALLKSAEMYDEDDKDCIMLDDVPVKVKMAPLPEITTFKREEKDGSEMRSPKIDQRSDDPTATSKQIHANLQEARISVDIPQIAKSDAVDSTVLKPAPKKRGRKAKKKVDVHDEDELNERIDVEQNLQHDTESRLTESSINRPALTELSPNTPSLPDQAKPSSSSEEPLKSASPASLDRDLQQGQGQGKTESPSTSLSPKKPVHSPLKPTPHRPSLTPSSSTTTVSTVSSSLLWSKPRVGLSRRTTIPSLLRKLDRTKEPPKTVERKEKLSKRQQEEEEKRKLEAEDAGEEYDGGSHRWEMRGKDGMLVEWDE